MYSQSSLVNSLVLITKIYTYCLERKVSKFFFLANYPNLVTFTANEKSLNFQVGNQIRYRCAQFQGLITMYFHVIQFGISCFQFFLKKKKEERCSLKTSICIFSISHCSWKPYFDNFLGAIKLKSLVFVKLTTHLKRRILITVFDRLVIFVHRLMTQKCLFMPN